MEHIIWVDSGLFIDKGWETLNVYRSVADKWTGKVSTVGIPIYEDDQVVVIALSHDQENDQYFGAQLIAKAAITKRITLGDVSL